MLPNLLEFTQKIINERGTEVRLFEIGKIYFKKTNKYHELRKAGIIYWSKGNANFFKFKGYIESLFSKMNLKNSSSVIIELSGCFNKWLIGES